ncbi:conserved hypothetical protein [Sulfolobus islandicus Y.G.57.14]|jgi:hypothetical protein|uniref:Uncharacterized protein n=4 Tax=Saccharolobus islandicus TaxID=43080 RepID=C3MPC2_SACI2|nr:hypothetical protein [Sulfolobus islandicus]ACP35235.1 conserved hypothetical protein [Sulfolobus islandicus L.S.2.15]ACP45390.1 conserved hypothetical protein [Sulfolobus islandicus Y.G.57.14]ACP48810.1 conserved hypothetical protein [Sulfolobus islandicus Y.N.15.51]ADB86915.1 conserved hypothetical protein [Sulfolobus islandicus L.D.8.5]PVU77783.1 hypothetical protein DDW12_05690 [Sulfolobus islandicus]
MKVVKYNLKAKIERAGKEPITIEKKFRKLVNARRFIDELVGEAQVKCTPLSKSETLMTKQCEGDQVKYFFEISIERIKKPKKEETKKEEKKQQQQGTTSQSP